MANRKKAARWAAFFSIWALLLEPIRSEESPFRALWIVRNALNSPEAVDSALAFASRNQFHQVFVQVRGRGDALYQSDFVPRSRLVQEGFDPLRRAIDRGHAVGLEVHAWVNVYLLWSATNAPADSSHLLHRHPEWVDARHPKSVEGAAAPKDNGTNGDRLMYLSPAVPGVNEHLLSVFDEILTRYEVDGLHLDYVRYGDVDYGYHSAARGRFADIHGFDPTERSKPPAPRLAMFGWKRKSDEEVTALWESFKQESVSDLVRRTGELVLQRRPTCRLSAAVKPSIAEAVSRFSQEWNRWLTEGWIDFAVQMNYETDDGAFARHIAEASTKIPSQYRSSIVVGVAAYNQPPSSVSRKIDLAQSEGFGKIAVFAYDASRRDAAAWDSVIRALLD